MKPVFLRECKRCGTIRERFTQERCQVCATARMRKWRRTHPMTEEQKRKDNARSYAGVYKRRGKLTPQPCAHCGSENVQMHHEDYDRPLDVTWLCRPCHLAHHRKAA